MQDLRAEINRLDGRKMSFESHINGPARLCVSYNNLSRCSLSRQPDGKLQATMGGNDPLTIEVVYKSVLIIEITVT